MKKIQNIIFLLALCALYLGCVSETKYGHIVVSDIPYYEHEKDFFPHDKLSVLETGSIEEKPFQITSINENIEISNHYSSGFHGHTVSFLISPNHEILEAKFNKFIDAIDQETETIYMVEGAILNIDNDPFMYENLTGKYTLQIREEFISADRFRKNGYNDTTIYYLFQGKFKQYSDKELETIIETK